MKSSITIIVLAVLFSNPVYSDESDHWNYIEASRVIINSDILSESPKGFALDSKYTLNDIIFLSATYQKYGTSLTDVDRVLVGFGVKYEVNKYITPFAQFNYVDITSKTTGFSDFKTNYWIVSLGISGAYKKFGYKVGLNSYEQTEENVVEDNSIFLESYYSFNEKYSAGLEVESLEKSKTEFYNIAIRFHF